MATLENLFMQIFERRDWIVEQLKPQKDLFEQSLASSLVINGIPPPSWLWNPPNLHHKELKKEDLISGLLFLPLRAPITSSSGCCTVYSRPAVKADNAQFSDNLLADTCASNGYFDDANLVAPKSVFYDSKADERCITNEIPEVPVSSSPQVQMDAKIVEPNFEHSESLARIQRSRTRQKALELRNSASEKSRKHADEENVDNENYGGRVTRSQTAGRHLNCIRKSLKPKNLSVIDREYVGRVTRSRSATQKLSLDKSLKSMKPLDLDQEDEVQEAAGSQKSILYEQVDNKDILSSNDVNEIIKPQTFSAEIVVSGVVADSRDADHSVLAGLKTIEANSQVGLENISLRPPTDINSFVEPKQLVFDDIKECSLNEDSNPALGKETKEILLRMDDINKSEPGQSLNEESTSEEKHDFSNNQRAKEKDILHMRESLNEEKETLSTTNELVEQILNQAFNDMGWCCLNQVIAPTLVKENQDCSLEVGAVSQSGPAQSLKKETIYTDSIETGGFSADGQLQGKETLQTKKMVSREEKTPRGFSAKYHLSDIIPALGKENCNSLSEMGTAIELGAAQPSYEETAFGDLQARHDFSTDDMLVETEALYRAGILTEEEENLRVLNESCHAYEKLELSALVKSESDFCPAFTCKHSNLSSPSPRIVMSEICGDAQAALFPTSNYASGQIDAPRDNISTFQDVDGKIAVEGQLQNPSSFGLTKVFTDPETVTYSDEKYVQKFDGRLTENPESCPPEADGEDGQTNLTCSIFNDGVASTQPRESETTRGPETEHSVTAAKAVNKSALEQKIAPKSAQICNGEHAAPYSFRNCAQDLSSYKSGAFHRTRNSLQLAITSNNAYEISEPMHKRRKTEGQQSNVFSASHIQGTHKQLNEPHGQYIYQDLKCSGDSSEAIPELQHLPTSHESAVDQSNIAFQTPAFEISGSMRKRRKTDSQQNNTSPILGQNKQLPELHGQHICEDFKSSENALESVPELQHLPTFHQAVVDQSNMASETPSFEVSGSMHKKRKNKVHQNNVINNSLILAQDKQLSELHGQHICGILKNSEDASKAMPELHHLPTSHESVVDQSNIVFKTPGFGMHQKNEHHKMEGRESSRKLELSCSTLQVIEGASDVKGKDQGGMILVEPKPALLEVAPDSNKGKHTNGDCTDPSKDTWETTEPSGIALDIKKHCTSDDEQDFVCYGGKLPMDATFSAYSGGSMGGKKSYQGEDGFDSNYLLRSPHIEVSDFIDTDEIMPEFEGFSVGPLVSMPPLFVGGVDFDDLDILNITKDQAHVLQNQGTSTGILTPQPPSSRKYKIHKMPDVYHSLPNGLMEQIDLRSRLLFSGTDGEQPKWHIDSKQADVYCNFGTEGDGSLLRESHSACTSTSSVGFGLGAGRPFTPVVGKHSHRIISKSTGTISGKEIRLNPELTCFRIDEESCTNEENGHLDNVADLFQKEIDSRSKKISNHREAFADVTSGYFNSPMSVSAAGELQERGSLESIDEELNVLRTQTSKKKQPEKGYGKYKSSYKENQNPSLGGTCTRKATEVILDRISRAKFSAKARDRKGSRTVSEKSCKTNNIVSNISSFIPLVHKKQQAAAALTGKRDIKVKALEAAETAKRLEEKKECERKMRKEAAKIERAKLEQENLRQLELKQKRKEEERKKKEADIIARKRQREEEDRMEKERKRRCMEEARRQQREHDEKLRAEKELRRKAADEEHKKKQLVDESKNPQKSEGGMERHGCTSMAATATAGEARCSSNVHENCDAYNEPSYPGKVVNHSGNMCQANENCTSSIELGQEVPSYELSPYQGSDDEEEEEDVIAERKFIPSWAREKSLARSLSSLQQLDPIKIFPRERCCSLRVLLPRKQQP